MVFPIFIVFPLQGEDDLLIRLQLEIFALARHLLPIRISKLPAKLSAHACVRDEIVSLDILRAEPLFQLRGIGPGGVNPIAGRFDETPDFKSEISCLGHSFLSSGSYLT